MDALIAVVIVAFLTTVVVFILGYLSGKITSAKALLVYKGGWKLVKEESPPNFGSVIVNYPVALFDAEFGVVVDQAEYHPKSGEWLSVPHGDVMRPYAWYDLPFPEWPKSQHDAPRRRVDDYI